MKVALQPADPGAADLLGHLAAPLRDARAVFYPALGLGFVNGGSGAGDADAIAEAIEAVRRTLAASGGSVVVHDAPPPIRARLDVWGVPLMRNVKQRLDPERRLAPGRFVAGI
jgi:glycolate oxidase FAD binding subunit